MLQRIWIEDGVDYLIEAHTGEIKYEIFPVTFQEVTYRKPIDSIGIEAPGELQEWALEGGYRLSTERIEELIQDSTLSDRELRVLMYIGSTVVGQNITFITVKDIIDKIGVDKSQVSRILKSLEEKKYIILEHKNTFGVGSRVLAVNPNFWWCGNYSAKTVYQKRWSKIDPYKMREILYSCPLPEDFYTNN